MEDKIYVGYIKEEIPPSKLGLVEIPHRIPSTLYVKNSWFSTLQKDKRCIVVFADNTRLWEFVAVDL